MCIRIKEFAVPFEVGERAYYKAREEEVEITLMEIVSWRETYNVRYRCKGDSGIEYLVYAYELWELNDLRFLSKNR